MRDGRDDGRTSWALAGQRHCIEQVPFIIVLAYTGVDQFTSYGWMIRGSPTMTALFKLPKYNQFAKCSHSHIKYVLVVSTNVCETKQLEFAGKVKTDQRFKN